MHHLTSLLAGVISLLLLSSRAVSEVSSAAVPPTSELELRFQLEPESFMEKESSQAQTFKCQVRLANVNGARNKQAIMQQQMLANKSLSIDLEWLRDGQLLSELEQVNVVNTEIRKNSTNPQADSRRAHKSRLEVKNTLNLNQAKLSSRLTIRRLRTDDSGRYLCRAQVDLASGVKLAANSSGSNLWVVARGKILANSQQEREAPTGNAKDRGPSSEREKEQNRDRERLKEREGEKEEEEERERGREKENEKGKGNEREKERRVAKTAKNLDGALHATSDQSGNNESVEQQRQEVRSQQVYGTQTDSDGEPVNQLLDEDELANLAGRHRSQVEWPLVGLIHKFVPEVTCYIGLGENYRGKVSTSIDNRACVSWSEAPTRSSAFSVSADLDLAEMGNYCRNPDGDLHGPWCFVQSTDSANESVKIACKLSACSSSFWLYLVAPVAAIFGALSCLALAALKSMRKAYGRKRSLFSPKRSKTFPKMSKILASGRSSRSSGSTKKKRKKSCGNYLDDDVFEIVHDIDWSEANTTQSSYSPRSSESLKLNSSLSPSSTCDMPTDPFPLGAKSPVKPNSNIKQYSIVDLLHPSPSSSSVAAPTGARSSAQNGIMFATLRCQMRAPPRNTNHLNQVNKSTSTFIETKSPQVESESETVNSMTGLANFEESFTRASELPRLEAASINIALNQQTLYEGKYSQVRMAFIGLRGESSVTAGRIGKQVAVNSLKSLAAPDSSIYDPSNLRVRNLNHLNLLKIIGLFVENDEDRREVCSLVYDMSQLVDLSDWLKQQNRDSLTSEQPGTDLSLRHNLSCVAKQIALAIDYLHDRSIIHKDLAARNCFLDPTKMLVKLSSFNQELILPANEPLGSMLQTMIRPRYLLDYYMIDSRAEHSQLLPLCWIPLESILFNKFDQKTDIWSFGCLIYELFSLGEVAFFGYSSKQIIDAVRANLLPPQPLLCPVGIYKLMSKCLSDMPSNRPCIKQIYEQLNLYSGQCSSFLDHHLCLLASSGKELQYGKQAGIGAILSSDKHQACSSGMSKTKSYANIQFNQCDPSTPSDDANTSPKARPTKAKMSASRSIHLAATSTSSVGCTKVPPKLACLDGLANQYDEPVI